MEKIMFFVIPEMPSKTFVMVLKKLRDHLNYYGNIINIRIAALIVILNRKAISITTIK
mgnify:CR=1 FL=1